MVELVHPTEQVVASWRAMLQRTFARNQLNLEWESGINWKLGSDSEDDKEKRFDKGVMEIKLG